MVRTVWALAAVVAGAGVWSGCTCNASEYTFPENKSPPAVDPPTSYGNWLSFDASPDGQRLTMSYYDRDRTGLGYAVGTPNPDGTVSWLHEHVDGYPDSNGLDLGNAGKYSSQKTMPDGTVWIAYQDVQTGALKAAHRLGPSNWVIEVVDGGSSLPGVGHWASLAIGADGQPVIAHCDNSAGAVRLSRYDGSAWKTTQIYASKPVDVTDELGVVTTIPAGVGYTDLFVAPNEELIAVYDSAAGDLHLLHGSGGAYEDTVVDSDGDVGAWPSVWSDGTAVWIAYQDVGNEDLRFASVEGSGPVKIDVIDEGELRGADTALFVRSGEPNIVYYDGMDNDMWLASRSGSSWTTQKLGGDDGAVGFHNEVVLAAGQYYAGSFDYTANKLFLKAL